jgi:hypothetical protein
MPKVEMMASALCPRFSDLLCGSEKRRLSTMSTPRIWLYCVQSIATRGGMNVHNVNFFHTVLP